MTAPTADRVEFTMKSKLVVLGKMENGRTHPKTFTNLKQANAAAEKHGGYVTARWPFLVVLSPRS